MNKNQYSSTTKIYEKYDHYISRDKLIIQIKQLDNANKIIQLEITLKETIDLRNEIEKNFERLSNQLESKSDKYENNMKPLEEQSENIIAYFNCLINANVSLGNIYSELKFWKDIQDKSSNNSVNPQQEKHKEKIKTQDKIQWYGTHKELVEFFKILYAQRKLSPKQSENLWATISAHFENSDGSPISNKSLQIVDRKDHSKQDGKAKKKLDAFTDTIKKGIVKSSN